MTPDTVFTLSQRACPPPGDGTADLGAIRRTDAIIDLLAARRLHRPRGLHDPAVSLLHALSRDVDAGGSLADVGASPVCPSSAGPAMASYGDASGAANSGAAGMADWVRTVAAAAAVATLAGAATTTGIAVTGILLRLARQSALPSQARSRRS